MGNERFTEDTYEQALLGLFQSLEGKLAYLRDTLLPKLMSGQIKV